MAYLMPIGIEGCIFFWLVCNNGVSDTTKNGFKLYIFFLFKDLLFCAIRDICIVDSGCCIIPIVEGIICKSECNKVGNWA